MANWGPDAAEFRPERWFEEDADYLLGASGQQQAADERGWAATVGAPSPAKASAAFEMGVVHSASTQVAPCSRCLPTDHIYETCLIRCGALEPPPGLTCCM